MCNLSIVVPTIRTHLLEDLYQSFCDSCNSHSFEVIFVGPFDIPDTLRKKKNVKYIKDYGQPSRAAQLGLVEASGDLFCWVTDDCFCYPNTLSETIEFYTKNCIDTDIVGMRFFENPEHYKNIKEGATVDRNPERRLSDHPDHYWFAKSSYPYLPAVKPEWGTACLFMSKTHHVKMYGGWDCQWEHLNHATHDLLFRMQNQGNRFFLTEYDVFVANWYEGTSQDHAPVHYGQLTHDVQLFNQVWTNPFNGRQRVNLNNWQDVSEIWERRFGNSQPQQYTDIYKE
jgi:hypothetical protein